VTTIIRLNKKCYDKRIFTKAGFDHHDMYFVDGTTPSDQIIAKFNDICEKAKGMLAVHCKSGLGRTGSCVGCYMMKHYAWTAQDVIAWLRICRPGSVIGPQQQFLERQQKRMWREGDLYRKKHGIQLRFDRRISNHKDPKNKTNNSNTNDEEQKVNHQSNSNNNSAATDSNSHHKPLPTDPGQNQGAALRQAKASVQHQQGSGLNSSNKWEMSLTSDIGNLGHAQTKGNGNGKW